MQELGLQHRFSKVSVSESMRHDLVWWWRILQSPNLNGVPMRFCHALPPRDVVLEIDASDHGLCALDMAYDRLFTYEYSAYERELISDFKEHHIKEFDINFRELLSAAFAVFLWCKRWSYIKFDTQVHVHFRIDNTAVISWQTKMGSRNARARVLLRLFDHWEHSNRLRSSSHIAGVASVLADLGSRLAGSAAQPGQFKLLTYGWCHGSIQGITRFLIRSGKLSPLSLRCLLHHAKYRAAFDQWTNWCARVGHSAFVMKLSSKQRLRVTEGFIIHSSKIGYGSGPRLKSTTISAALHGVKHFFSAYGVDFPSDHKQIRMLIK